MDWSSSDVSNAYGGIMQVPADNHGGIYMNAGADPESILAADSTWGCRQPPRTDPPSSNKHKKSFTGGKPAYTMPSQPYMMPPPQYMLPPPQYMMPQPQYMMPPPQPYMMPPPQQYMPPACMHHTMPAPQDHLQYMKIILMIIIVVLASITLALTIQNRNYLSCGGGPNKNFIPSSSAAV